jgi:hypothetical protein
LILSNAFGKKDPEYRGIGFGRVQLAHGERKEEKAPTARWGPSVRERESGARLSARREGKWGALWWLGLCANWVMRGEKARGWVGCGGKRGGPRPAGHQAEVVCFLSLFFFLFSFSIPFFSFPKEF